MTELQKPLEDPKKPGDSFRVRLRRGLRLGLDNPALPVVMLLMIGAFATYLYLEPNPANIETVKEAPSEAGEESDLKGGGTYEVKGETVEVTVKATGTVRATKTMKLFSQSDGLVKVLPAAIGAKVTSATVIVELETGALQKKVDRAKLADELAQTNLNDAKASSEARPQDIKITQLTADLARADLEAAEASLAGTKIKPPRIGRLDKLHVTAGQVVTAGQLLAEVVNEADYVVECWVRESDAFALEIDASATVSFASRPSEVYTANISNIGMTTAGNEDHDGIPIQIRLANNQKTEWLRAGLWGAKIEIPAARRVIPVPRVAVSSEGDSHVVFVKAGDQFIPRAVTIGLFDEDMIEVVEGLEEDEIVAVD